MDPARKKTTDNTNRQTYMATSGTEKDKNTKHAQIKSAAQKTEKTRQMSRQTAADLVFWDTLIETDIHRQKNDSESMMYRIGHRLSFLFLFLFLFLLCFPTVSVFSGARQQILLAQVVYWRDFYLKTALAKFKTRQQN